MIKKRYIGLDVFRVLSCMVICAFHTTIHLGCNYGILQEVSLMGAVFMTAFFLLSGFAMYISYQKHDLTAVNNIKKFLIKRIIGIVPLYYIVSVIYIIVRGNETTLQNLILAPIEILGLQSTFTSIFSLTHNGGTWFISCIFICYLIYPYLQELAKQFTFKVKIGIIVLCSFVLVYAPFVVIYFGIANIYSNPFYRLLEFLIGVLLASIRIEMEENLFCKKFLFKWGTVFVAFFLLILGIKMLVQANIYVNDYMFYSVICLPLFMFILFAISGVNSKMVLSNVS